MKVVGVETIRIAEYPAMLFLQIHTDEGVIGLGENCVGIGVVEEFIHESIAPRLLGKDPLAITSIHEVYIKIFLAFKVPVLQFGRLHQLISRSGTS